jgi:Uracil DNA glycosylase superfamily
MPERKPTEAKRKTFAENILHFLRQLGITSALPDNIEVMNPFNDPTTWRLCGNFYHKFYNDQVPRHLILGINPGRFGGGITGIPFTDPIRMESVCGIKNHFVKKQELSSVFIYEMIAEFGGALEFYKKFYFSSISPLGFTNNGKNCNYYDDPALSKNLKPFIIDCLQKQIDFGLRQDRAFCLGEGKNYRFLNRLNDELHFFDSVIPLPHPRFIMQYKLKKKHEFIQQYLGAFALI